MQRFVLTFACCVLVGCGSHPGSVADGWDVPVRGQILLIGDTQVTTGYLPAALAEDPAWQTVGSICAADVCHDGVPQSSFQWLLSASDSLYGAPRPSPFYNNGRIDFESYLNGIGEIPDVIVFSLGINRILGSGNNVDSEIATELYSATFIMNEFRRILPWVTFVITTPPVGSKNRELWRNFYGESPTVDDWTIERQKILDAFKNRFSNKEKHGIVYVEYEVDPAEYNYQSPLCPGETGAFVMAQQLLKGLQHAHVVTQ